MTEPMWRKIVEFIKYIVADELILKERTISERLINKVVMKGC